MSISDQTNTPARQAAWQRTATGMWNLTAPPPATALLLLVIITTASSAVAQGNSGFARVRGKVLDEDGNPVPNASIILQQQGANPGQQRTTAQADGSFDFPAAPKAIHTLCVHAPGSRTLNPCIWSPREAVIDVNVETPNRTVKVAKAGILRLRVADPANLTTAGGVIVGVWTRMNLFYPLPYSATDKGERILEMAVPYEEPLRLGFLGKPVTGRLGAEPIDSATWRHSGVTIPRAGTGVIELRLELTGASK